VILKQNYEFGDQGMWSRWRKRYISKYPLYVYP